MMGQVVCVGQAGNWVWARQAGGTHAQEGYSCATDAAGNVYATGYFEDSTITFGTITLHSNGSIGNQEMFLVKYSPTGIVEWAISAAGSCISTGTSVATDLFGNVYLTGSFQGTFILGSYTLTCLSYQDVYIAKFSSTGTVLWAQCGMGSYSSYGYSVATDPSGNAILVGIYQGATINFGTYTLTLSGGIVDVFTVSYSPSGVVQWAKTAGGIGGCQIADVATDASGNIYISGSFESPYVTFDTDTLTSAGSSDIYIVKYSSTGTVIWAKRAGGTSWDGGASVITDYTGNIYVTGCFISPTISFGVNTFVNQGAGQADVFITKYSAAGNVVVAKSAGSSFPVVGYSLASSVTGTNNAIGIYLTGSFYGPSIIFDTDTLIHQPLTFDPMFIVKYDENLNVICATFLESGGDDNNAIATDNFGNAYIAGDFAVNPFIVGTDSFTLTGTELFFVAKYNCSGTTVSNSEIRNPNFEITIYPNPATNNLTITFAEPQKNTTIKILNLLGETVNSEQLIVNSKSATIDVSDVAQGMYFVQITDETKNSITKKIIVQ